MLIDPTVIAHVTHWVSSHVVPVLPVLLNKAEEEAAKGMGEDIWKSVKNVWAKLLPKVEQNALAKAAVEAAAEQPEDEDTRQMAKMALAKLIKEDTDLAEDLLSSMPKDSQSIIQQTVTGDRNITIGGPTNGGMFITGDNSNTNK